MTDPGPGHISPYKNLQSGTALNLRDDSSTTLLAVNFSSRIKAPEDTTRNKLSAPGTDAARVHLWLIVKMIEEEQPDLKIQLYVTWTTLALNFFYFLFLMR